MYGRGAGQRSVLLVGSPGGRNVQALLSPETTAVALGCEMLALPRIPFSPPFLLAW